MTFTKNTERRINTKIWEKVWKKLEFIEDAKKCMNKMLNKIEKNWQKRIELMWKRLSSSHNKDPKWYRDKENRVNHSKRTASRKESNNRREN